MTTKKIHLALLGENGNAFNLLGLFRGRAKEEGWTKKEIEEVIAEARSGDYDHLLSTLQSRTCSDGFECEHESEME